MISEKKAKEEIEKIYGVLNPEPTFIKQYIERRSEYYTSSNTMLKYASKGYYRRKKFLSPRSC